MSPPLFKFINQVWFVVWSVGFFIRSSTLVTRRCQNFIIQLCLTQRARAESFCCDFEILGKQCAAVWAVGGLCRCRSRDGSTRGDPPGYARLNVVKAHPRDGKFPPITPTGGCKSSRGRNLETVFSGWCDSGFDPGIYGFNWFIIVLNSRCESVESGSLNLL